MADLEHFYSLDLRLEIIEAILSEAYKVLHVKGVRNSEMPDGVTPALAEDIKRHFRQMPEAQWTDTVLVKAKSNKKGWAKGGEVRQLGSG